MTDYKQLCAQLLEAYEILYEILLGELRFDNRLAKRARAALVEPEPEGPTLKEQALQAAQRFYANGHEDCNDEEVKDDFDIIRRALESLPD